MNTNSPALIVPPPNPAAVTGMATNDIRGLKGPVEVPVEWERYLWLLAFLAAGLALLIIRRVRQRLFARLFKKPEVKPIPPHVRARQRLHAALHHISDPRAFCF